MIRRYVEPIYKSDHKFISCSGTKEIDHFMLEYKKAGGVKLKKIGVKPIYKQIQAQKVNCDLQSVIEACVHQNQLSACTSEDLKAVINDFSGMQSMPELFAGVRNLNETWNKLPLEVREQFGSSQVAFVNGLASPDFKEKVENGFALYDKTINKRLEVSKPIIDKPTVLSDNDITPPESDNNGGEK